MDDKITIAIDAMGGENSPEKNIEIINIFLKKYKNSKNIFFNLYGKEEKIKINLKKFRVNDQNIKIFNCDNVVSDEEKLIYIKLSLIQKNLPDYSHRIRC